MSVVTDEWIKGGKDVRGAIVQQSVTTEKWKEMDRMSAEEIRQIGAESKIDSTVGWKDRDRAMGVEGVGAV